MAAYSTRVGRLQASVFALLASACLTPSAIADVHTVGSTGDFAQIQSAVDASADGDTLLVQAGTFQPFTVDDKSLWILAYEGAAVTVTDTVDVKNLASGKTLFVYGVTINEPKSGCGVGAAWLAIVLPSVSR